MLRAQHAIGAGPITKVVEHAGDLTHRMSKKSTISLGGYASVEEKVDKLIHYLTYPYGLERETEENIVSNASYYGLSPSELRKRFYDAMDAYAKEHEKVPVFNRAQLLGRDVAISIGERRYKDALGSLRALKSMLDEGQEAWTRYANEIDYDIADEYAAGFLGRK